MIGSIGSRRWPRMPIYEPYLFSLRPEERKQLDDLATRRGVSRAAILRAGLALVAGERPSPKADRPSDRPGEPVTAA
jgi:hypothetical protein